VSFDWLCPAAIDHTHSVLCGQGLIIHFSCWLNMDLTFF